MIESAIGELAIVVDTTSACQASALPEFQRAVRLGLRPSAGRLLSSHAALVPVLTRN